MVMLLKSHLYQQQVLDEEGTQTLTAGKRVTLYNPDLLINGDGEYVVEANNSKGYTFQVPYNQITGWKRP